MITSLETTPGDVAGHYDQLDRFYREIWGEHVHHGLWITGRETPDRAVDQLIDRLADPLQLTPGDHVCDVGCGYGGTSRYLAEHYGFRTTGLTISPKQYEHAVEKTSGDDVCFLLQDWQTNSLEASSFDGLVSIECIAHVPNKKLYFEQIHRVLRPGGRAAITAWLTGDNPRRWERRRLLEPICREGRLPGMGNRQEYTELLEAAGLRLLNYDDLTKQVRRTWGICGRRLLWGLAAKSSYRAFLLKRISSHSVFLKTIFRIWLAYRTGAMRYGLFVMQRD